MRLASPWTAALLALSGCWVVPTDAPDTGFDWGDNGGNGGDNGGNGGDNGGNGGDNGGIDSVVPGELSNFQASIAPNAPNVVIVEWETNLPGESFVRFGLDGDLSRTTPVQSDGTEHRFLLLGLKSNRSYSFQAVTETEDGQVLESGVNTATIAIQPDELPVLDTITNDASALMGGDQGFVMFTIIQMDNSWIAIVDRDGDYVWYLQADEGLNIPSVHVSPEGDGLIYTQNDRAQQSDYGGIVKTDWEGNKVLTRATWGHHDAIQVPGEDTIALINVEIGTFDMDGRGDMVIAFDNILENALGEGDPDAAERVWSFNHQYSDYPHAPWRTCNHFDAEAYDTGGKDWTHSNSLMASADGRYLYMMSKNLDAIVKIERATGTMVWQMGGRDGEFEFEDGTPWLDSPDQWSHGHMSQMWDDGFCMFDNGYHHDETAVGQTHPRSRIIQYRFDENDRTIAKEWEYWLQGDNDFNAELGDCKALANGNYLMSVTNNGYLAELDNGGDLVWEVFVNETNAGTGRLTYLHDMYSMTSE